MNVEWTETSLDVDHVERTSNVLPKLDAPKA